MHVHNHLLCIFRWLLDVKLPLGNVTRRHPLRVPPCASAGCAGRPNEGASMNLPLSSRLRRGLAVASAAALAAGMAGLTAGTATAASASTAHSPSRVDRQGTLARRACLAARLTKANSRSTPCLRRRHRRRPRVMHAAQARWPALDPRERLAGRDSGGRRLRPLAAPVGLQPDLGLGRRRRRPHHRDR